MKNVVTVRMFKKGNVLSLKNSTMEHNYRAFIASLKEGDQVECMFEFIDPSNTTAQLAKIHVCLKEIADETGVTAISAKKEMKRRCGMAKKDDKGKEIFKSFAECSKEELSLVIENIIQVGVFLNLNFDPVLR